ncbi:MAG TPA: tetratricopeptide repeat protein, partial [Flavipsychrobacter sp.]|nr:tetratricopeptide repeat protein [Flavipsychrobacter sp.]
MLVAGLLFHHFCIAQTGVIDSLKSALSTHKERDTVRLNLLLRISMAYYTGHPDSMMRYSRRALVLSEKIGSKKGKINALAQVGTSHMQRGNNDSALYYCNLSLILARKYKLRQLYPGKLNQLGTVYFRFNDYNRALKYYDSAMAEAKKNKDSGEVARAINNTAIIQFEQGDYISALKNHIAGLELNEKLGNLKDMETGLLNITNIFFRLGEFDKAKEYAARAMRMANRSGSTWSVISNYTTYAMIYNAERKYDSSLASLQKALVLARSINNAYLINLLNGNMAECYLNMDSLDAAYDLYSQSLKASERLDDMLGVAIAKGGLGQILVRRGNTRQGTEYMTEALDMLQANGLKEQAMAIADTLASFYARNGDYKRAYAYYRIRDAYADSLARDKSLADAQRMAYDYELQRREDRIDALEKDKRIERTYANRQQLLSAAALAGMLLAMVTAIMFFRNLRSVKRRNEIITRQKREIEQQAERLEQLNRFKDTTFSVLSHDLRSPVNALTGTMAMLDEGIITP